MSDMKRKIFSADGTEVQGTPKDSLMVMLRNTFGGGTLTVERYSEAASAYVPIAQYTATLTDAEEIKIGAGAKMQFKLAGATSPNLTIDYWFV